MKARTCLTVAFIFPIAVTAWSQEPITKVVPRTYSLPIPHMDKGKVEGRTYSNASIGLEFSPPAGLAFGAPELKGTPGTVPLLVTVAAWGEQRWDSPREGAIFYADALAYYPDEQHSTEAYVHKIVRANRQEGFEPVGESFDAKLGGVAFSRTDFKKSPVYEAVLVKACTVQAFVFIFAGSEQDAVNKLISGTEVKLDDSRSGCGPGTSGTWKTNPLPTGGTIESHTPSINPGLSDGGGVGGKIYSVGLGVSALFPFSGPSLSTLKKHARRDFKAPWFCGLS